MIGMTGMTAMTGPPILQDMQVHSTFSDGRDAVADNVAAAELAGLHEMTCVDHVRRDTPWVPAFVEEVARAAGTTPVRLLVGVEAKLLNASGRLDLPDDLDGVDRVYVADHQVPLSDGPHRPEDVRSALDAGTLTRAEVLGALVASTAAALSCGRPVVIAHLFSVLPRLGLAERDVPQDLLASLAGAAAGAGAWIEVNERYRCPTTRTLLPFVERGVPVLCSTDSHRSDTIGRYRHCRQVRAELGLAARE
jgi:putative hydrolase